MQMTSSKTRVLLTIFTLGLFSWGPCVEAKPPGNPPPPPSVRYTITRLGTLGGTWSMGWGMNNHGDVVGASQVPDGQNHAYLYTAETGMVDLNTLIDANSGWKLEVAYDINDGGQIVGNGCRDDNGDGILDRCGVAFRIRPATETEPALIEELLGLGGDGDNPRPMSINNDGDVAGHAVAANGWHAALWSGSEGANGIVIAIDLGMLQPNVPTFGAAINDRDVNGHVQIVGRANTSSGQRAWRYDTATEIMQTLPVLITSKSFSSYARADDINFSGAAVGSSKPARNVSEHAVRYSPTNQITDLGTLGGTDSSSSAYGINDQSDIVGDASNPNGGPRVGVVSFQAGPLYRLEPLIDGLPADLVGQIIPWKTNNAGQICGPYPEGFWFRGEAFLLTPQ